ncbi:polyketide cyclase [Hyphomicrobium nitrativorans NL23]|uniref:Polyketide cyclase n=1 Tax=Hyphomicrobium nitrativorans NL23 TaxID=1029756 RepID=V5SDD0_9HYPH|nr:SRPBCC family protein [Hyphomicrobium nitrativorans]AHB48497.1 polyketide cyclase [Hyphomicrobium nitrativorans NL23]
MIETVLYIAAGLAALAGAVVAYAWTRPDTFRFARSTRIAAAPEAIFPLINDLKAFSSWSPFERKDPNIKSTYSGPLSGIGQRHDWDGNREVGAGSVVITESVAPSRIGMELTMLRPMKAVNQVTFTLVPDDGATTVTWAMEGRMPLVSKVLDVVVGMDRMCGAEFEAGLAALKDKVEAPRLSAVA